MIKIFFLLIFSVTEPKFEQFQFLWIESFIHFTLVLDRV